MQPPDTEPTTAPSSHSAMIEPTGRGDEPQVRTTVASSARLPAARQSRSVRSTITSRFSMAQAPSLASAGSAAQRAASATAAPTTQAHRALWPAALAGAGAGRRHLAAAAA
jgi:hypothetical protein